MIRNILIITWVLFTTSVVAQDTAEDLYKTAKAFDAADNLEKAIEFYTKTIEADPTFENAYYNRGMLLIYTEQFPGAIRDLNHILINAPSDYEALFHRSDCYYLMKQNDSALIDLSKAIELNPDYIEAFKSRYYIYYENKEYIKAQKDIERLIALSYLSPEIYFHLAYCREQEGDLDNSLQHLNTAIEGGYTTSTAYHNRGTILTLLKKYSIAILDFEKAIELEPTNHLNYLDVALCYRNLGMKVHAKDYWKKVLSMGHDIPPFAQEELEN